MNYHCHNCDRVTPADQWEIDGEFVPDMDGGHMVSISICPKCGENCSFTEDTAKLSPEQREFDRLVEEGRA